MFLGKWVKLFIIVAVAVGFSLYTFFFLAYYYSGLAGSGPVIVSIGSVKKAEEIAGWMLDKYWSRAGKLRVYTTDIYWSRKDIQIDFDKYDLNYSYDIKYFVMNKILGQIEENTWLYFQEPHHPWSNVTWIQYDRVNQRILIYHHGHFSGDDPTGDGHIDALFYLDKYRFVIINLAPANYCLPNGTTFKYNGTYIKLPNPTGCRADNRTRQAHWRFWYIYFVPPYIHAFWEPYEDELAPVYVADVVVITHNETDKAFMDKIFNNYIEELRQLENKWIKRFNKTGFSTVRDLAGRVAGLYFDLRKLPNTPNNTMFFKEFERNLTDILWHTLIKSILNKIHVHVNNIWDITFAILVNKHNVIYLEPLP